MERELTSPSSSHTILSSQSGTFTRVAKYTLVRFILIALTVIVAVYLTIVIANLGGFVDEIMKANVNQAIGSMLLGGWLRDVPMDERAIIIEETREAMLQATGIYEPFLERCLHWLANGLTLNWGESYWASYITDKGLVQADVRVIILSNLSRTLLLFGTANVFLFFTTVSFGLMLVRKYNTWLDKLVVGLTPLSSAPSWVYGILINIFMLKVLSIPTGGVFDSWSSEFNLTYLFIVLKHMSVPFLAIFLSGFFQSVYAWRTFFLYYSGEHYVDVARAKGMHSRDIERRYVLKPALPGVITSFALLMVGLWQEVIALEYFFNVAGIGNLFVTALGIFDTPMIVALVVTFAYLLAITVFLLDIVYAIVDPRVRVMGESKTASARGTYSLGERLRRFKNRRQRIRAQSQLRFSPRLSFRTLLRSMVEGFKRTGDIFSQLLRMPMAVVGMMIILILIGISVYTIITIPYNEAVVAWRGGTNTWNRNPMNAPPAWVNRFREKDLPETFTVDSRSPGASKQVNPPSDGHGEVLFSFPFEYDYVGYPQEVIVTLETEYERKLPHLIMTWVMPDGQEVAIQGLEVNQGLNTYYITRNDRLKRVLRDDDLQEALFVSPDGEPLPGTYELQMRVLTFEDDVKVDAELTVIGQVYGLAGTDSRRRDLMIGLLWGTPVALAFGLIAAVGTSLTSMIIAAIGTWFGGWIDALVQWITEVNMILPFFPISLMIYTMYSKSIWVVLGVTVLLSIFGNTIKTYRAVFLQVKEEPYIEAAQSYGVSDGRIITNYLVPRIMSVLIPQIIVLVPSYVFLEATLSFLGLGDPTMPTWGKLVVAAMSYGAHFELYHLVALPLSMLLITGFAFAMIGRSLERIFDPRLREG